VIILLSASGVSITRIMRKVDSTRSPVLLWRTIWRNARERLRTLEEKAGGEAEAVRFIEELLTEKKRGRPCKEKPDTDSLF
jgi:hypothetical protein